MGESKTSIQTLVGIAIAGQMNQMVEDLIQAPECQACTGPWRTARAVYPDAAGSGDRGLGSGSLPAGPGEDLDGGTWTQERAGAFLEELRGKLKDLTPPGSGLDNRLTGGWGWG